MLMLSCQTMEYKPIEPVEIPRKIELPRIPIPGRITSHYGPRGTCMHKGIDIANIVGTPVEVIRSGKVVAIGYEEKGYGNFIIVRHWYYDSLYAHLNAVSVKLGQLVKDGQIIGTVGNTGRSSGPHLHFEIIKNGKRLDPKHYINIGEVSERH